VLADGRLVELDDPATLLGRDSEFRRMWETQQLADVWTAR
jgi:ABC-type multidrug transport system fused ATPase/permease subunit